MQPDQDTSVREPSGALPRQRPPAPAPRPAAPPPGVPGPHPRPLMEMLAIAGPTVATMVSYTAMQFVDKLIVSRIGPEPIYVGAQGNGGLAAFVPIAIAMGVLTVINTYVSQNLGAGRPERGPAYAWNGMWIAAGFWAVILIPYGIALPSVLAAMRGSGLDEAALADVIRRDEMAVSYGRILIFGAVLTMWTRGISQYFYGMHRAGVIMVAGVVANVVNIGLTYALVFGRFGLPALGVPGSAIGTVIATGVELAIPLAIFVGPTFNARFRTRSAWRPSSVHLRDLLRIGWPGGLMFGNEMLCWGYFMVGLVGRFGKEHSTAGWIAHQYMSLSFMPTVGISVACTALVGKYMGMGRPDLAAHRARLGLSIALVYMVLCGVLFVVLREPMVLLFVDADTPPSQVQRLITLGSAFLIATAAFQAFDAVAMTMGGSLRGAGDTVVPGLVTVFLAWGVIVGGGEALVYFAPQLGSIGPWIAAAAYISVLGVYLLGRFINGRWKQIRLIREEAEPTMAAGVTADGVI